MTDPRGTTTRQEPRLTTRVTLDDSMRAHTTSQETTQVDKMSRGHDRALSE